MSLSTECLVVTVRVNSSVELFSHKHALGLRFVTFDLSYKTSLLSHVLSWLDWKSTNVSITTLANIHKIYCFHHKMAHYSHDMNLMY